MVVVNFLRENAFFFAEAGIFSFSIVHLLCRGSRKAFMYISSFAYYLAVGFAVGLLVVPWPFQAAFSVFLVALISAFVFKEPFYIALFYTIMIHFFFLMSDLLLGSLFSGIFGKPFEVILLDHFWLTIYSIISKSLVLFISVIIVRFFSRTSYRLPPKHWIILSFINVCYIIVAFVMTIYIMPTQDPEKSIVMFVAVAAIFIVFILIIVLFSSISKYHFQEELVLYQRQASDSLREQISLLKDKDAEFRKYQHQWANNLGTLSQMINEGSMDASLSYIQQMCNAIPKGGSLIKCGILILDAVFALKKAHCDEHGIDLRLHFQTVFVDNIEELDIASVVSNLLDNAILAVVPLAKEEKIVDFTMSRLNNYLIIQVENKYSTPITYANGYILSSKRDDASHGWGLLIANDICEKYAGSLDVSHENMIFKARVILCDLAP